MSALEGGRALLHARRLHQSAGGRGQVADRKFVDTMRNRRRGHIHVKAQLVGGERAHKLTRLLDVAQESLRPAELNMT
jgi:hypothetical protein